MRLIQCEGRNAYGMVHQYDPTRHPEGCPHCGTPPAPNWTWSRDEPKGQQTQAPANALVQCSGNNLFGTRHHYDPAEYPSGCPHCTVPEEPIDDAHGVPLLVLQYIEGDTLARNLEGALAWPASRVLEAGITIASALEEVHAAEICRIDLKPSNIMLRAVDRSPILIDFGTAQQPHFPHDSLTQSSEVPTLLAPHFNERQTTLGTPLYMSPEQATGKGVDIRADIWSLSLVLLEMLLGKHPLAHCTRLEDLLADLRHAKRPLASLNIPVRLRMVLDKGLAYDRAHRYSDPTAFKRALLKARSSLPPLDDTSPAP